MLRSVVSLLGMRYILMHELAEVELTSLGTTSGEPARPKGGNGRTMRETMGRDRILSTIYVRFS